MAMISDDMCLIHVIETYQLKVDEIYIEQKLNIYGLYT